MATPPSDETKMLFKLLSDREWHRYEEIHLALAHTIPPGKALRRYENRLQASRGFRGDNKTDIVLSETEQIDLGQRGIAQATISSWKGRGIIQRGDGPTKEIKIKPGFQSWGLAEVVPSAKPGEPQTGAPQDPPNAGGGYPEVPRADSEPSSAARAAQEQHPEPAPVAVASVTDEPAPPGVDKGSSFRPVEPLPRREPNSTWIPEDQAHYAWPGAPRGVTGEERVTAPTPPVVSCLDCGAMVGDQEIHEDWHVSQASAESHQIRITFDEETERAVADRVQEAMAPLLDQALDRFQQGMQDYLETKFAQLEACLINLQTAPKRPDRWH